MDNARWQQLERAFEAARALSLEDRERWLALRDAEDPELAREVRALLEAEAASGALDDLAEQLVSLRWFVELDEDHESAATVAVPARIGPYVVAREIGRGAMGVVWQAHDPRLGRDVALKIFPQAVAAGTAADTEPRVLAEARAASALDHPNICTIYDVGSLEDGRPYLAMAYYAGGTLADRLTSGPLRVEDATRIALQVAEALAVAHAAGIVHRDVKPRNIAFGDRGEAKLLDFGVALLRDRSGAPGIAGTPAYMAPEQVRGEPVDARTDVWALGVVLFTMLTGKRPFDGGDHVGMMHRVLHEEPPEVSAHRAELSPALAGVVTRALRKSPAERFDSAGEMADALRASAVRPNAVQRARPERAVSRRWRVATMLGVAGVIGLAAILARRQMRDAPGDPSSAESALGAGAASRDQFVRARDRVYGNAQETEEAIRLLHAVLDRNPRHAPAHALLSRAYVRSVLDGMSRVGAPHWVDSAIVHARHAIAIAPKLPDGHAALGFAYASNIRHADAVPEFLLALDLDPRHAQTMMDLARSYMALDRFADAVTWQERALSIEPTLPGARMLVVARYNAWELYDHSRRHVDLGLRLVPTDVPLQNQAIFLDLLVNDTASARRRLNAMLPLLSPTGQAQMLATLELQFGNVTAARRHVDRVVGTSANSTDFLLYGMVYRATGDRARGDSLLRRRLTSLQAEDRRVRGRSTLIASALAHTYSVLGQRDSALREFARWDSLGGVASRHRLTAEVGWATLRTDPRWEPIVARMDGRFQAGREAMRARLDLEFPVDSASSTREVQAR